MLFLRFLSFSSVSDEKDKKLVLMQKQIISTSERRAEHPFADQNTQQETFTNWQELDWDLRKVSLVATKNIYKRKSLSTKKKKNFVPILLSDLFFNLEQKSGKKLKKQKEEEIK